MPTKRLHNAADLDHLKHQARDLLADFRHGNARAFQRIREFHPRFAKLDDTEILGRTFVLSDALLSIAREYGYASWPRLKTVVQEAQGLDAALTHNERVENEVFRQALDLLDEGEERRLRAHLADNPGLIHQQVFFEGDNYFTDPTLIEFVAENPVRQGRLPGNIVEIARIILNAGARENRKSVNAALGLTASGRVAREQGAQIPLISLFCDHGADPDGAVPAAAAHGEFEAVEALIANGAALDLATAAALGLKAKVAEMSPGADSDQLQRGLALSALHGRSEIVALLLKAGADPDRYNPQGADSHCTPLHSAALAGHLAVVQVLVDHGARCDIVDVHHNATALVWAEHGGHGAVAALLSSHGN